MHSPTARPGGKSDFAMGFPEFVTFIAMLMAVNALGIDIMLPALPAMGEALGIASENQRQWIIAAYVFGFGASQLIYGPLIDRYGRRPVLIAGMGLFALTCAAAAFAFDFTTIIIARVAQGVTAAASRVLATSIMRDRYSGRTLARVGSLAFIVFLAAPILAPSIGQLILYVAPWQTIFLFLSAFGMALTLWGALRLPETLRPEYRRPIAPREIAAAAREVLGSRWSLGYTLAGMVVFGSLMGYINSVQQIFADVFDRLDIFAYVFAAAAASMALSSWLNAAIVERMGTRMVSHSALLGFILIAALHLLIASTGMETIWTFSILQGLTLACFGLAASNFGAMAMEPVGHIAGTAAAIQGFISTVGGAAIGILIGQSFNGTTVPLVGGYLIAGLASLAIVLVTERGRLFVARHASPRGQ